MSFSDREWMEYWFAMRLKRMRAGNELTRELLSTSYESLAKARDLLKMPTPKVWHPEPRKSLRLSNLNRSTATRYNRFDQDF
jgi:hypothetical protein